MKMRDLLSLERVIPRLKARDRQDTLRKLAAHAFGDAAIPATVAADAVLAGAEMPVFGPAAGISLPHAFVPGLRRPIATFARLDPPVEFGAADGSASDLVVLLLSPLESPGDHLQALACAARTLRNPQVVDLLRATESRDALYVILCGSEEPQVAEAETAAGPTRRAQQLR